MSLKQNLWKQRQNKQVSLEQMSFKHKLFWTNVISDKCYFGQMLFQTNVILDKCHSNKSCSNKCCGAIQMTYHVAMGSDASLVSDLSLVEDVKPIRKGPVQSGPM